MKIFKVLVRTGSSNGSMSKSVSKSASTFNNDDVIYSLRQIIEKHQLFNRDQIFEILYD